MTRGRKGTDYPLATRWGEEPSFTCMERGEGTPHGIGGNLFFEGRKGRGEAQFSPGRSAILQE